MTISQLAERGIGNDTRSRLPSGGVNVSTKRVSAAIEALRAPNAIAARRNWMSSVARLVEDMRPDLAESLTEHIGHAPADANLLAGMSIGEIGVVYEALLALADHTSRRQNGQYFTPDDVSTFMASQVVRFPAAGAWLDPCCGVGNLSFALLAQSENPGLVLNRLSLIDLDETALLTAAALLVANFAPLGDHNALPALLGRSQVRDFLSDSPLPEHEYVIVNPPYARTAQRERFRTHRSGELYAYFLERVATESLGFIAITPASHLNGAKYAALRTILLERPGGDVVVFDNVPDTCFRGYKYGSTNTSTTNFVRAAVTVSSPEDFGWKITPILRWTVRSRERMFASARSFLRPLRFGPSSEWAKIMPETEQLWAHLEHPELRLGDLLSRVPTPFELHVASTPRYFISASKRSLDRGSKLVLWFHSQSDLEWAYLVLNSSLPYWWWRCIEGGITLSRRALLTLPMPPRIKPDPAILRDLEVSEREHVVTKLNAGRQNENVRRPRSLIERIDAMVLPNSGHTLELVYASDMFADSY